MRIKTCELKYVLGLNTKIPINSKKEFVLLGRSNVGKSSFINAIINRHNYTRTSSTPGKTRTINYYCINDKFYIVDFPGYGYAKASIEEQNKWAKFINKYLKTSENIEELILIVDIRHKPTDKDILMYNFILQNTGFEPIIIATKCDKIKKNEILKNINVIKNTLNVSINCQIIIFSAEKKYGVNEVLNIFNNIVSN